MSQRPTPSSLKSAYFTPLGTPLGLDADAPGGGAAAADSPGEARSSDASTVAPAEGSGDEAKPQKDLRDAERRLETEADDDHEDEAQKEDRANEVGWESDSDPENPQNWSPKKKWLITILVSVLTVNVTFASSAPSSATMLIAERFGVGSVVSTLVLTTCFLLGYCFGPIVWSTFSELFGRRPVFIFTFLAYMAFIIGQPLATNIQTFAVTRFLSGLCAASPLTNAGGVIADMHDALNRGFAMCLFSGSVFIGPVLGPIVGSFVAQEVGYKWIFWVILIFAFVCWTGIVLFLPETFAPVLLAKKAKKLRKEGNEKAWAPHERTDWSVGGVVKRTLLRPFEILALEPMLLLMTLYLSVVYGLLYGLFEGLPVIFEDIHGFSLGLAALPFIGVLIGTTLGAGLNVLLTLKYRELQVLWKGAVPPEERLTGAIIAGWLLAIGCFWLGWTGYRADIHWAAPAVALVPIGMSFTLIFISLLSSITDTYLMYSASALAGNTIFRSAFGAAFPLFTRQFFTNLGPNVACSILGGIAILLAPTPALFYIYGSKIRTHSRFAPCPDFKVRKELEEDGILPPDSLNKGGDARTGIKAWRRRQAEKAEAGNRA